ncbi:hypothetical protein [Streptomyces sp. NPDC058872]|uniref:hypothetical protein n=1 Tax=Streptomyces sp. NPDC058872 TaxID=3346661 RepID=UPI003686C959
MAIGISLNAYFAAACSPPVTATEVRTAKNSDVATNTVTSPGVSLRNRSRWITALSSLSINWGNCSALSSRSETGIRRNVWLL